MADLDQAKDVQEVWSVIRKMKRNGCTPDEAALTAVARFQDTALALSRAEVRLGISANASHWSIVIQNAVKFG